jgi:hypothetical protein
MKPLRYCEVLISLDGSQELSTYTVRHMTVGNVKVGTDKSIIAVTKVVSWQHNGQEKKKGQMDQQRIRSLGSTSTTDGSCD